MRKKQKKIYIYILLLLPILSVSVIFISSNREPLPPPIFAQAALIMDIEGNILFEKNAHMSTEPASITKLAAVAAVWQELSKITEGMVWQELNGEILITQNAVAVQASQAGFLPGDRITIYDALMAAMLPSGSEAVIALGEGIFGSEENLVTAMNFLAEKIGMENTYFTNSVGLNTPDHKTTAYDLALLGLYVQQNLPELIHFTSTRAYTARTAEREIIMSNTNNLLVTEGINGLKTGTGLMGKSSVLLSYQNNRDLIIVVINSPDSTLRRIDAMALLEFAGR